MNTFEDILKDERYKNRIEQLKSEDLRIISQDELKALDLARKGIEEVEPEKKEDLEYLQAVARGMQKLAIAILKKRSQN